MKSPFFPPGGSRDDSEHGIRPALPYFGHQLSKRQCGFDIISILTFKRNQESLNLILIFFIWQAHFAWKQQSQFNCIEKLRKQDFYHSKYFLCIFLDILLGMTMVALLLPCIPFLIPAWDVHVHLYHSVPPSLYQNNTMILCRDQYSQGAGTRQQSHTTPSSVLWEKQGLTSV